MDIVERLREIKCWRWWDQENGMEGASNAPLDAADEIERVRAENEELRRDAERYRWLRDCPVYKPWAKVYSAIASGPWVRKRFDELIDEGMAETLQSNAALSGSRTNKPEEPSV